MTAITIEHCTDVWLSRMGWNILDSNVILCHWGRISGWLHVMLTCTWLILCILCHSWPFSWATSAFITTKSNVHEDLSLKLYLCTFCMFIYGYICAVVAKMSLPVSCKKTFCECRWWVTSHNWKCKTISICSHVKWFLSVFTVTLMHPCFLSFHISLWRWISFVNTVYS